MMRRNLLFYPEEQSPMNKIPTSAAVLCAFLSAGAQAADLTVSAAASLGNAFKEIAAQYGQKNPHVKIRLNTAGSGVLLQQMVRGAPVDVVAFADQETMRQALAKNAVDAKTHKTFALNSLVVAAPANSPHTLGRLNGLASPAFGRIALGNPNGVPAGRYAKAALEKAGVWTAVQPKAVITQNVRQSLDYIARGEVDAGFVYRTDALLMKNKVKILHTVATTEPVRYPIAVAAQSKNKAEAQRFADYVLSAHGQNVLAKYGFRKP
ncbi:molybdate ABC transporter substrate-binding protein [Neisseria sp.]|uniref:molybdate ABC transporter substrate-binding protein n=1 Tax=Neisseria sp. TaxID=192066 RepID=UPI0035A0A228